MKNRIAQLLLSAVAAIVLVLGSMAVERLSLPLRYRQASPQLPRNAGLPWEKMKSNPYAFIMHAGGAIAGNIYSNSLEAVRASIARGAKLIELDLTVTADGHIVAAHDWQTFKNITNHSYNNLPLTLEQFKSCRIFGKYTPLDGETIVELFNENRDLFLFTDKIDDYDLILTTFPFMDRVYVEVFTEDRYRAALNAGIKHVVMSAYYSAAFDDINKYEPAIVALNSALLDKHEAQIQSFFDRGIYIFAYTINDKPRLKRYLGKTINGAYVDNWPLHGQ